MNTLRATVRLQLHADFDFDAAAAQVDYYARLGISHLYLSPVAQAAAGSTHGYDNTDPTRLSTELGGEAGFARLSQAVQAHGMGIVLDIVPNHMAASPANPWWNDVLRHGRRSVHADWFDIEWDAPGCEGKVWLPVLDRPLQAALEEGAVTLVVGNEGPELQHHDLRLPLSSLSHPAPADSWEAWAERCRRSPARLRDLLQRQAYRLAWWRTGADVVNYRRFFDISGLVALRVERDEVFDAVHALPLRLVREGRVQGLRIDHVDGLADPAGYLRRLRFALDAAGAAAGQAPGTLTLHVEKILADGEALPDDWCCDGTTGYDFMDPVGAVLHAEGSEPALQAVWQSASEDARHFDAVQRQARQQVLDGSLRPDLDRFLRQLQALTGDDAAAADLTPGMFARATSALLVHFPVYRTHGLRSQADHGWMQHAREAAAGSLDEAERSALQWIVRLLAAETPESAALRTRFEQVAAPLNAKAVEDTAFYRHARMLSRNEVGSDPARIALPPAAFVALAQERGAHWPQALLAVATHDHKRGPDARCRLAVLSWNVAVWQEQVAHWNTLAEQAGHPCPLPGAETLMLWQTLLGSWPLRAEAVQSAYFERVGDWLRKALREGKRVSRWSAPDEGAEQAALQWIEWLGSHPAAGELRSAMDAFVRRIAPMGARLGLAQLALQLGCPGVPDLYQGNEGWDFSLVDPDNRRAVDHEQRREWLTDTTPWAAGLQEWTDGAPKALMLAAMLQHRARHPDLYRHAPLRQLAVKGDDAVMALLREHDGEAVLLLVDRCGALERAEGLDGLRCAQPSHAVLQDMDDRLRARPWRNLLDGRRLASTDIDRPGALLDGGPVAVWVTETGEERGR